jgi:hypothetical protein
MPGGDHTGPTGTGSMSSRTAGYCIGYVDPGYMNPFIGRGAGRGNRHGRWGVREGTAAELPAPNKGATPYVQIDIKTERIFLEHQMQLLKNQLETLKKRLENLTGKEDRQV